MRLREVFFPSKEPTDGQMRHSQRVLCAEGAVASTLFSLGTGNFLAGYLSLLGASPSFCALIGALPQLGCVMQLISPFLFESLRWRKLSLVIGCFFFRFSLGFAALAPFVFRSKGSQLGFMFVLYLFAFLAAGFVTPGLNRWIMEIAPKKKRGSFFAVKDIISSLFNAFISLVMGWQLDYFIKSDAALTGYMVVFGGSMLLAVVDMGLMCALAEKPSENVHKLSFTQLIAPLYNKEYRGLILFLSLWSFVLGISTPFLPVHLLQNMHLSHTFISFMGIASSAAGMLGMLFWGRLADKHSFAKVLVYAGFIICAGYICWAFVTPAFALAAAPILQCTINACTGAFNTASLNLQYFKSPQKDKTAYLGICSALANIASYLAALSGTALYNMLLGFLSWRSISMLFFVSGLAGIVVLWRCAKKI